MELVKQGKGKFVPVLN